MTYDDSLGEIVDAAVEFDLTAPAGVFHASSIGAPARELYYRYQGVWKEHIKANVARAFAIGAAFHKRWEADLRKARVLVADEQDVAEPAGLRLRGRLDFIVATPKSPRLLLEVKSINSRGFVALKSPQYAHTCQWAVYSERTGITDGYIVYENKDTHEIKYFRAKRVEDGSVEIYLRGKKVDSYQQLVSNIYDRLKYVLWCINNKSLPSRCSTCLVKGCKKKELCEEYEKNNTVVSLQEWKEKNG